MTEYMRVPREPTPKMVRAGCAVTCVECFADCKSSDAAAIYRAMLAASPQEEGSSADPTPIKPSADTGELRGEVIAAVVANVHVSDGRTFINGPAIADAILDLIQSERAGSPIGQNA